MHSTELVVARYNENLKWLDTIPSDVKVTVYNKGQHLEYPNTPLQNIGRESDTYLQHIILNYNNIADRTIFVQGDPFYHVDNLLENIQKPSEGIIFLANRTVTDNNEGCPNHCGLDIKSVAAELGVEATKYTFAAGAQYIVPKAFIISKPLNWWERALEVHNRPTGKYRGNINDKPWIFERLWPNIWNHTL